MESISNDNTEMMRIFFVFRFMNSKLFQHKPGKNYIWLNGKKMLLNRQAAGQRVGGELRRRLLLHARVIPKSFFKLGRETAHIVVAYEESCF